MLEIIAAAQSDLRELSIRERKAAQTLYRQLGYRGSVVPVSGLERFLAAFTRANVHFDDHPDESRQSGRYETITVKSIKTYLERRNAITGVTELIYPLPFRRLKSSEAAFQGA